MQIGVDIDNVILDMGPLLIAKVREHFGRHFEMADLYQSYHLRDSISISRLEEIRFWQKYGVQIAQESEPKPFCRQALLWLKNQGFTIQIITSRPYIMKYLTDSWLKKHQVPFHDIAYGVNKKGEECIQRGIHFMIEDADHNILDLLKHSVRTIAFPYPYNLSLRHKRLIHISDWRKIAFFLMKKRKGFKGA